MELIKPQKGTNYNIEHDIQNLTTIEQGFEQIDNKITNDITSSIDELKDKVDNDITTAITELDNKVDTEIITAIDNLETKVNTEISESITVLDNKVTTSLQEQAESLKKEISDQIAKVVANSPEDFDTLKEISDWISGHSSDASSMNTAISGNTSAINQEILDRQAADTALQANIDKKVDKDLSNVTGVLPISKGGTEATTQTQINKNIATEMKTMDSIPSDTSLFAMKDTVESNTPLFARTALTIWNYIKGKIESITINLFNSSKIKATGTSDITLTSFDTDPLTVGTKTSTNLGIDGNEIQARTNGTASILHLNNNGGDVYIGTKGTFTDNGLSYNGNATTATQATGAIPFNAAQQTVTAGTITRAVAQNVIKKNNGYISRIALGLTNKISQFSDGIISLGSNDAGTTWEDFTLKKGTGGEIITSATIGSQTVAVAGEASSCTGNSATATKATQDGSGNNIVNTYATKLETPKTGAFTMVGLGFTKDGTVSVRDFAKKIVSSYGSAGVLRCNWETAKQGFVGSSSNRVLINGGTLVFSAKGSLDNAWNEFTAIYTSNVNNKTTLIACSIGESAAAGAEAWTVVDYLRNTDIDSSLSSTSTKPVQNRAIYSALMDKASISAVNNKVDKNSRITIADTTSVTLASYDREPLSIGTSEKSIGINNSRIQARTKTSSGATTGVELDINREGGIVYINRENKGGGLVVKGRLTIPTSAPSSPQAGDIWIG